MYVKKCTSLWAIANNFINLIFGEKGKFVHRAIYGNSLNHIVGIYIEKRQVCARSNSSTSCKQKLKETKTLKYQINTKSWTYLVVE